MSNPLTIADLPPTLIAAIFAALPTAQSVARFRKTHCGAAAGFDEAVRVGAVDSAASPYICNLDAGSVKKAPSEQYVNPFLATTAHDGPSSTAVDDEPRPMTRFAWFPFVENVMLDLPRSVIHLPIRSVHLHPAAVPRSYLIVKMLAQTLVSLSIAVSGVHQSDSENNVLDVLKALPLLRHIVFQQTCRQAHPRGWTWDDPAPPSSDAAATEMYRRLPRPVGRGGLMRFVAHSPVSETRVARGLSRLLKGFMSDCRVLESAYFRNGLQVACLPEDFFFETGAGGNRSADHDDGDNTMLMLDRVFSLDESWKSCRTIGKRAFESCGAFHRIELVDSACGVVSDRFACLSRVGVVQIARLRLLHEIGADFLANCKRLQHVSITDVPSLRTIGPGCMTDCGALKQIELGSATSLTVIPANFAQRCHVLERCAVTGTLTASLPQRLNAAATLRAVLIVDLPRLEAIGDACFSDCDTIEELWIVDCPLLQSIGHEFAARCGSLVSATLRNLPSLTSIGDGCFVDCTALVTLDMDALPRFTSAGERWLRGTCVLPAVSPTSIAPEARREENESPAAVATLGGHIGRMTSSAGGFSARFLCIRSGSLRRSGLTAVDLSRLATLESIQDMCLADCPALEVFAMRGLPALRTIGDGFLSRCPALRSVSIANCPALETVGQQWLACASVLETCCFAGLASLRQVGRDWLLGARALCDVSFAGCTALEAVGNGWLDNCDQLRTVTFALSRGAAIGNNGRCMAMCRSLIRVSLVLKEEEATVELCPPFDPKWALSGVPLMTLVCNTSNRPRQQHA